MAKRTDGWDAALAALPQPAPRCSICRTVKPDHMTRLNDALKTRSLTRPQLVQILGSLGYVVTVEKLKRHLEHLG